MASGVLLQVFDSYGKKCNSRFLLNYGFAVEVNRDADGQCHNEVRIMLSLHPEDKFRDSKLMLLGSMSSYVFADHCSWVRLAFVFHAAGRVCVFPGVDPPLKLLHPGPFFFSFIRYHLRHP